MKRRFAFHTDVWALVSMTMYEFGSYCCYVTNCCNVYSILLSVCVYCCFSGKLVCQTDKKFPFKFNLNVVHTDLILCAIHKTRQVCWISNETVIYVSYLFTKKKEKFDAKRNDGCERRKSHRILHTMAQLFFSLSHRCFFFSFFSAKFFPFLEENIYIHYLSIEWTRWANSNDDKLWKSS